MKSATPICHLRCSECDLYVSYGLHKLRICFPFELVHLKFHSLSLSLSIYIYIYIYICVYIYIYVCVFYDYKAKIYTEFHAEVHRARDDRKCILFTFIILQRFVLMLL